MPDHLTAMLEDALARTPEWLRQELASKKPTARRRAEEALAVTLAAVVRADADGSGSEEK